VEIEAVKEAAGAGGLELERVSGEGTQYCYLLLRSST
jgi:hypothetical protein